MIKSISDDCLKIDLLSNVLETFHSYIQFDCDSVENGGYLIGYQNAKSKNITVANCTISSAKDIRQHCFIRFSVDNHDLKSYCIHPYGYMGTWHTHPEDIPCPSELDMNDWKKSMSFNDGASYNLVFIIVGRKYTGIWLGKEIDIIDFLGYI